MVEIKDDQFYRPSEIVKNGWILNSRGKINSSSYNYVVKLVNKGMLTGVDYATNNKKPFWKVQGREIKRYLREVEKREI